MFVYKVVKNFIRIAVISTALLAIACAQSSDSNNKTVCNANVVDKGLQLSVKQLGTSDDYVMELCAPATPATNYTVYGAITEVELQPTNLATTLAASRRSISIVARTTGENFQVKFYSTDRYFAIYQDQSTSSGYAPQATAEAVMVVPHLLPGK
jgi:hypothetical protein